MSKILAIDYGTKRVGIATGNTEFKISFPRDIILNKGIEDLIEKTFNLVKELNVNIIVIGLPLDMKEEHEKNVLLQKVQHFQELLKEKFSKENKDIKIEFFDERLSSFEADEILQEIGVSKKETKLHRDAHAAQVILQRWFDKN